MKHVSLTLLLAVSVGTLGHIYQEGLREDCGYALAIVEHDLASAAVTPNQGDGEILRASLLQQGFANIDTWGLSWLAQVDFEAVFTEVLVRSADAETLKLTAQRLTSFCPVRARAFSSMDEAKSVQVLRQPIRDARQFAAALAVVGVGVERARESFLSLEKAQREGQQHDRHNVCRLGSTLRRYDRMQGLMDRACQGGPGQSCPIAGRAFLNQERNMVEHLFMKGLAEYSEKWGADVSAGHDILCADPQTVFAYEK